MQCQMGQTMVPLQGAGVGTEWGDAGRQCLAPIKGLMNVSD